MRLRRRLMDPQVAPSPHDPGLGSSQVTWYVPSLHASVTLPCNARPSAELAHTSRPTSALADEMAGKYMARARWRRHQQRQWRRAQR